MSRDGSDDSLKLYQMGGFRAQPNQWNDGLKGYFVYRLAKTLFPPSGEGHPPECLKNEDGHVQLTFGIKKDGASCLLVTRPQLIGILRHYGLSENIPKFPPALIPSDFLSLSPAIFETPDDLQQTIRRHTPKAQKKKSGRGPTDTSQANSQFSEARDGPLKDQITNFRSYFEHARIVYRAYQKQSALHTLGYFSGAWGGRISGITTFSMTIWKSKEMKNVLDFGWSQLMFSSVSAENEDVKPQFPKTTHLRNQDHGFLRIGATAWVSSEEAAFTRGSSEKLTGSDCKQRIVSLFDDILAHHSQNRTAPHILIVHDEKETCEQLETLGINTSEWSRLFTDLLSQPLSDGGERGGGRHQGVSPSSSQYYSRSSQRPRDHREMSPPRRPLPGNSDRYRDSPSYDNREGRDYRGRHQNQPPEPLFLRPDSPPPPTHGRVSCAPIYIVDIRRLFGTATNREQYKKDLYDLSFREVCTGLGITSAEQLEGWSAGHDAEYLLRAWSCLSGGPTIDRCQLELHEQIRDALPRLKASSPTPDPSRLNLLDAAEAPGLHGDNPTPPVQTPRTKYWPGANDPEDDDFGL